MKYELVCPECGMSEFTMVWENITLFEGLNSLVDSEDGHFTTTYWAERRTRVQTVVAVKCLYCEFEVELTCSNNDEDENIIFNKLMDLLIEEKCALEV